MITKDPKNILLAEDTALFRNKISMLLSEAGHKVMPALDGWAVIEEISSGKTNIGALILDIDMPHIDGFRVLDWLRENGVIGRFPVLCVTNDAGEGGLSDYVRGLGACGVLAKGACRAETVETVNNCLFSDVKTKRKSERVYRTIPAAFTLGTGRHQCEILNISSIGVFINTPLPLNQGAMMRLEFKLSEDSEAIATGGVVMWVTGRDSGNSRFAGAGVEFKNPGLAERRQIDAYIRKHSVSKSKK